MSHEIEADFVYDYHNEDSQCQKCTSFENHAIMVFVAKQKLMCL